MGVKQNHESLTRRQTLACLLVFANELEKAKRISKAGKGLLKELIVHENEQVMAIGDDIARAIGEQGLTLDVLEEQIKQRASKSHQELFEICSLEQAHLLSQQDTEALSADSDTKSLVYGEIDFWSFYDIVKMAVDGIDTSDRCRRQFLHHIENGQAPSTQPRVDEDDHRPSHCQTGEIHAENNQGGTWSRQDKKKGRDKNERQQKDESRGTTVLNELAGGGVLNSNGQNVKFRYKNFNGDRASTRAVNAEAVAMGGDEERRGLKFYDLGSGSGRAVFAAVLAVDFRCVVGIEVLAGVHRASTRVLKRYRKLVEPVLCSPALIKLYNGSFLSPEFDWTDGDVVFANSTCFAEDTLSAIAERAACLRPGARVVTFTTALKTPWLRVLLKRKFQMSWGSATVFVHQKLSPEDYARRIKETTPFDEDQGISWCDTPKVATVPSLSPVLSACLSTTGDADDAAGCGSSCRPERGCTGSCEFDGCCSVEDESGGQQEEEEKQACSSSPRRPQCC